MSLNLRHFVKKCVRVTRTLAQLWCAQMFGEYIHSGWNGEIDYARYNYKGKEWIIPTSAVQVL